jgi:hypothetical protein
MTAGAVVDVLAAPHRRRVEAHSVGVSVLRVPTNGASADSSGPLLCHPGSRSCQALRPHVEEADSLNVVKADNLALELHIIASS